MTHIELIVSLLGLANNLKRLSEILLKALFFCLLLLQTPSNAQTVRVSISGASDSVTCFHGERALLEAVQSFRSGGINHEWEDTTPNLILIQENGPYLGDLTINFPLTLRNDPEENPEGRPVLIGGGSNSAVLEVNSFPASASGVRIAIEISDLIIIPSKYKRQPLFILDDGRDTPASSSLILDVTLRKILFSGNDGSNLPVSSLDGLALRVPYGSTGTQYAEDAAVTLMSLYAGIVLNATLSDVIITAAANPASSVGDGLRILADGPGTIHIGPGCVLGSNSRNGLWVIGAQHGKKVELSGQKERPVIIWGNGTNGAGIEYANSGGITNANSDATGDGIRRMEWVIIANNQGHGYYEGEMSLDTDPVLELRHVTIANNHPTTMNPRGALVDGGSGRRFNLENVIIAGDGSRHPANLISLAAGSILNARYSAIVLEGDYQLDRNQDKLDGKADGVDQSKGGTFLSHQIITYDPLFGSLLPFHPYYLAVSSSHYFAAGENASPLTGGSFFLFPDDSFWFCF